MRGNIFIVEYILLRIYLPGDKERPATIMMAFKMKIKIIIRNIVKF